MKNRIYSVCVCDNNSMNEISSNNCFEVIEKESKRGDGTSTTTFLFNALNGQRIKIPPRFQVNEIGESARGVVDEGISADIRELFIDYSMNKENARNHKGKSDLAVLLNFNTMSPFLSITGKNAIYVYVTIDTHDISLVRYSKSNIINTFKNPKMGILGCLVEITEDIPFTFYTRDNTKFGFKAHCLYIDKETNDLGYGITNELEPDELKAVRNDWNRKKKTRTFLYNYNIMPSTHLSHTQTDERPNSIVCKRKDDCKNEEEFVKEVESSLKAAFGYVPKAVVLDADFDDMSYEDMIKLRFTYVFGTRVTEDGSSYTVTLKSN